MYKEVAIMWKNKERSVDYGGVFGLSIITHVTLQKIVAHDFRYDPCTIDHGTLRGPEDDSEGCEKCRPKITFLCNKKLLCV